MTLREHLESEGIPTDSHESDLYALDTPRSRELAKQYKADLNLTTFRSSIDGRRWIELPFQNEAWWEARSKRTSSLPKGDGQ